MANTDKISALVQTVRQLNWEVRPKIAGASGGSEAGSALHDALAEIRNNELKASQLIRSMSLAESTAEQSSGRAIEQAEASTMGSRQLLSEFATAREAILSILRNLSDNEWTEKRQTPTGESSYEAIVDGLIESDKQHLAKIMAAVN